MLRPIVELRLEPSSQGFLTSTHIQWQQETLRYSSQKLDDEKTHELRRSRHCVECNTLTFTAAVTRQSIWPRKLTQSLISPMPGTLLETSLSQRKLSERRQSILRLKKICEESKPYSTRTCSNRNRSSDRSSN